MSTNNELSLKLNLQHKIQALEILAVWSDSVLSEEKTRRSLDLSRRHPSASTCWGEGCSHSQNTTKFELLVLSIACFWVVEYPVAE